MNEYTPPCATLSGAWSPAEFMKNNAALQKKKSAARMSVAGKVFAKDGRNDNGKYRYMTEASYKQVLNGLLTEYGLELTATETGREYYTAVTAKGSQMNGVRVTWQFVLSDTETGFYETSSVTGDGLDVGDKAIYKAHTGAMKYFIANTFAIATGDDAEAVTPEAARTNRKREEMELFQLIATAEKLKRDAEDAGIDMRSESVRGWITQKTGIVGDMLNTIPEAKRYIEAVEHLIRGKTTQVQA